MDTTSSNTVISDSVRQSMKRARALVDQDIEKLRRLVQERKELEEREAALKFAILDSGVPGCQTRVAGVYEKTRQSVSQWYMGQLASRRSGGFDSEGKSA